MVGIVVRDRQMSILAIKLFGFSQRRVSQKIPCLAKFSWKRKETQCFLLCVIPFNCPAQQSSSSVSASEQVSKRTKFGFQRASSERSMFSFSQCQVSEHTKFSFSKQHQIWFQQAAQPAANLSRWPLSWLGAQCALHTIN